MKNVAYPGPRVRRRQRRGEAMNISALEDLGSGSRPTTYHPLLFNLAPTCTLFHELAAVDMLSRWSGAARVCSACDGDRRAQTG